MLQQTVRHPAAPVALDPDRELGVEIEFTGIAEDRVAGLLADWLDGESTQTDDQRFVVSTSRYGAWGVELDTAWNRQIAEVGPVALDLARAVVPVEIVTAPLRLAELPVVEDILDRLAMHGAKGSRENWAGAYGVHFNPAEPEPERRLVPVMRAYAAIEPWLRRASDLDLTRQVLPFVDSWPKQLTRALLDQQVRELSVSDAMDLYLTHVRSRNHGLDLLPLFRHLDAQRVDARVPDGDRLGARPTYHFRLPECRLDEPFWSLGNEWAKWWLVETVAADRDYLGHLTRTVSGAQHPAAAAETLLAPLVKLEAFSCLDR